jgi:hypothetical protein
MLSDNELAALHAEAERFRLLVDELDEDVGEGVRANVRARLRWNPNPPHAPKGQEGLSDEIHELLDDKRLTPSQSVDLERDCLGGP